ncbi:hypothetical protein T11_1742 [Trichinella zimbabwensis]|uniref:Uncharacterized protein n=1 Tax=Trichinella zimbabwensis TaxID=268475 RepID=A0A0V1I7B8_9BILA|nr:hypothetical protein T11_1742 [Trichinella zimbabwensis]
MWTWICARPGGICDSGASSLKNPCVRVAIKSSQMLCRLRTVNSIPPFGGSATSWWTEVCDYRRHIHCLILDVISSSSFSPISVDELRDVSKVLMSVNSRLELIPEEFKQQNAAIELRQEQTRRFSGSTGDANCSSGPCFTADSSLASFSSKKATVMMPARTPTHATTGPLPSLLTTGGRSLPNISPPGRGVGSAWHPQLAANTQLIPGGASSNLGAPPFVS